MYVTQNDTLHDVAGLSRIWLDPGATPQYYPLVHTSYWIENHLWGLHPLGYHVVNVLLHALAATLFWAVLSRLEIPHPRFVALVFALHPVHVESVAWVTERKNTLSLVFYLAAALCYWRALPPRDELVRAESSPPFWQRAGFWYASSLVCFAAALLSKSVTATLPAALLVVSYYASGQLRWRDVAPTLPMFALGIGFGLHTAYLEMHHVGAKGELWDFSLVERFLIAGRAAWFLCGQACLAQSVGLHLSPVGSRRQFGLAIPVPDRYGRIAGDFRRASKQAGARPARRLPDFRRHPVPSSGVFECLPLPLFVCGRPFSVSRELGDVGAARLCPELDGCRRRTQQMGADGTRRCVDSRPWVVNERAVFELSKSGNALGTHHRPQP